MKIKFNKDNVLFERNPMIYGHFLEHFHRQVYGGLYDPNSKFADEDGFRKDVIEALKEISTPIIRWPGGCFVSSYHWKNGVGERVATYDKAWRVEEPNTFGTDEFIKLCRKVGCEPYICTNAGTGTQEEMSDWVEYCNLDKIGIYAKERIKNGNEKPFNVKYWSVGNENYGSWEIGAEDAYGWSKIVAESAKMMKRVDPQISLSAAALADEDWNKQLLDRAERYLDWISIHEYWLASDFQTGEPSYERCMIATNHASDSINKVKKLLAERNLIGRIKIAFDEWNLRYWYHPTAFETDNDKYNGNNQYLLERNNNDINSQYTMADAIFTACFLNGCLRNADVVGMANFSPIINTRGAIFTHENGIVRRTTFYVFKMYTQLMGKYIVESECDENFKLNIKEKYVEETIDCIDYVVTKDDDANLAISLINKHPNKDFVITIDGSSAELFTLSGDDKNSYNDIDNEKVVTYKNNECLKFNENVIEITVKAHSVNVLKLR